MTTSLFLAWALSSRASVRLLLDLDYLSRVSLLKELLERVTAQVMADVRCL
jgi:hypothetical protein